MRILVTGANGYLGQGITKILVNQGVEVVATDLVLDRVDGKAEKKKADLFTVKILIFSMENRTWCYIWRGSMDLSIIPFGTLRSSRNIIFS